VTTIILRLPAVRARTGLSRSTIYQRIDDGRFPKPIRLGRRAVGWIESEIEEWLAQLIKTSRKVSPERKTAQAERQASGIAAWGGE
jgi:prophage regulatory protein